MPEYLEKDFEDMSERTREIFKDKYEDYKKNINNMIKSLNKIIRAFFILNYIVLW